MGETEKPSCSCPEYEPYLPEWDGVVPVDPACPWHGERRGNDMPPPVRGDDDE